MTAVEPKTKVEPSTWPAILPHLGDWMVNTALAGLVWQAVSRVETDTLRRVAPPGSGPAFEPVNLLAMLTYSYAVGVLSSQDVEAMMLGDSHFRRLVGDEFPRWKAIRRFRRYNGQALRRCLAETFRLARGSFSDAPQKKATGGLNNCLISGIEQDVRPEVVRWEEEAADRVEQAIWMDDMATDDEFA